MTNTITSEQYCSLSPQDRAFYLEHKDDTEMCVHNGKLHIKVRSKPRVTWDRFQELLHLPDNLTNQEKEALHIGTNFGDWNPYGRPYLDYGFYYWLDIDCSAYGLKTCGINQPTKEWLADWLSAHGFTPEEISAISYSGGISGYWAGIRAWKSLALAVREKDEFLYQSIKETDGIVEPETIKEFAEKIRDLDINTMVLPYWLDYLPETPHETQDAWVRSCAARLKEVILDCAEKGRGIRHFH